MDGIEFDGIDLAVVRAQATQSDCLDLSVWRRCIVDDCERERKTNEIVLRGHEDVKDDGPSEKPMHCRLQHAWAYTRIQSGDIVSIQAKWNDSKMCYCVSSSDGFIVVRPDSLVSGTSVVGGLFCLRRAILSDRFKGIDSNSKIVSRKHVPLPFQLFPDDVNSWAMHLS